MDFPNAEFPDVLGTISKNIFFISLIIKKHGRREPPT